MRHGRGRAQVECCLPVISEELFGLGDEQTEFSFVVDRADVADDASASTD